jgi:hypothetical protein
MKPATHQDNKKLEEILIVAGAAIILLLALATLNKTTEDSFNQISANALASANISALREMPCNFTLQEDYNLVSFFCITLQQEVGNVTQNITQIQAIFEYQEGALDAWKSYNPDLPSYVIQDLVTLSRKEGYWIEMKAPEEILIPGGLRVPTSIDLSDGWNLVGYPTNTSKNITISLLSLYGNYSEVRSFNPATQSFLSHTPPAGGGLTTTDPYQGYWIKINNSNEVWIVD